MIVSPYELTLRLCRWVYHCVDLPIVIRSIYSRDNSGSLNRIYVIKKGKDDLFVDEIYIGTNKPSTDTGKPNPAYIFLLIVLCIE